MYQSHYGHNTSCMVIFVTTYREETLRCPYKDYTSCMSNEWKAEKVNYELGIGSFPRLNLD
jgi:hypothetical protein